MSTPRPSRSVAALALGTVALLGLGACSSDGDDASPTTETTAAPAEETTTTAADEGTDDEGTDDETTTTEATDDGDDAPAGEGEKAEWAEPFETPGELLTTVEGEGFKVDIYQVGTAKAPKDGNFVDPETNESILKEGDEIVFLNYVMTNTGDEAIPLSFSLVDVTATYADWPWMQGMDTVSDRGLWEEMGVLSTTITPGGEAPFMWEPGTSFAMGDNFYYDAGKAITFDVRLTPADEEGDLVHDEKQEIEVESTIK